MSEVAATAPAPTETPKEETATPQVESKETPKKRSIEETIFSKEKAADQKFREAAELRKKNEEFERLLEEDPEKFFLDPRIPKQKKREIAEKILMKELEEQLQPELTAEQKELEELRGFKKKKEDEDLSKEEQEQAAQFQKVVAQRQEALASLFKEALDHSPLSKNEATSAEVVREMAMYMKLCHKAGHKPTPQEIAGHVESRFMSSFQGLAADLEGEELVNLLGKDIIKKLRKYDLGQLESRMPKRDPITANEWQSREDRSKKQEYVSPKELSKMLRGK
jgi:hypothetical protein